MWLGAESDIKSCSSVTDPLFLG